MKRFLILFMLVASFANLCLGREMRADAMYGVRYAQEQVAQLPDDEHKPYLTIVGNQGDPRYQTICQWFDSNATLQGIKDQCHFSTIPTQSPHFFERLAPGYRELPCVRLHDAQGNIAVEFAGNQLPMTADALAHGLNQQASVAACFRRTPNRVPNDPAPQPLPAPKPQGNHFPWILLGVLVTVGGGLGLAKGWRDLYHKK
jgi:hypothetical protein